MSDWLRKLLKVFYYEKTEKGACVKDTEDPKKQSVVSDFEFYSSPIKILALADLHFWEKEELHRIKDYEFDVCVLLGDIQQDAISEIVEIVKSKPILAVQGNHDTWEMFEGFPIMNLHCKKTEICGVSFAGFGGSVRYKKGPYAMHTEEECRELISDLPKADILISHDCMHGLFGKEGSHAGLKGISEYIQNNKVKLNLCGHHHQMCVKKEKGCTTVCVYRCALVTYPEVRVKEIF